MTEGRGGDADRRRSIYFDDWRTPQRRHKNVFVRLGGNVSQQLDEEGRLVTHGLIYLSVSLLSLVGFFFFILGMGHFAGECLCSAPSIWLVGGRLLDKGATSRSAASSFIHFFL